MIPAIKLSNELFGFCRGRHLPVFSTITEQHLRIGFEALSETDRYSSCRRHERLGASTPDRIHTGE